MRTNCIVAEGHEFNYPANAESANLIKQAGGRSKMTKEQLDKVEFKTVVAGDDCSDMPEEILDLYITRGWVIDRNAVLQEMRDLHEMFEKINSGGV